MYNNWQSDLKDSIKALKSIKDTYLNKIISGNIYSVEDSDNEVLLLMDKYSGIDYVRLDYIGLQGIAARVQWGKAWDTFTIRFKRITGSKTEYDKRIEQIQKGYFYPAFTLQAYFDNKEFNNFLSAGIIRTLYLYEFIENNTDKVYKTKSDNEFIFVNWKDLDKKVKIVRVKQ